MPPRSRPRRLQKQGQGSSGLVECRKSEPRFQRPQPTHGVSKTPRFRTNIINRKGQQTSWNLELYHLEVNYNACSMCKNGTVCCCTDLLECGRREHRCEQPSTKTWCFQLLQSKEEYIDFGQHRSPQDAKTRPRSRHVQGRQRRMGCWQRKSPVQRFRIPHWEVHTHGIAADFLICIRDLSFLSSRRHVRRGVHAEQICVLGKVLPATVLDLVCTREMLQSREEKSQQTSPAKGTASNHFQLNRTAETCTPQHRQDRKIEKPIRVLQPVSFIAKTTTETRFTKPLDVVPKIVFRMTFSCNDQPSLTADTVEYHVVVHVQREPEQRKVNLFLTINPEGPTSAHTDVITLVV